MSATSQDAGPIRHPSPYRHRVGPVALAFGLFGGPLAWAIQFNVNYAVASHACFPNFTPRTGISPIASGLAATMLAVNAVALLIALAATVVAWRAWSATREEHGGDTGHLLQSGEGRSRFLAACGLMAGVGFFVGCAFNTVALLWLPQCAM